jgi:hypothetical protein
MQMLLRSDAACLTASRSVLVESIGTTRATRVELSWE